MCSGFYPHGEGVEAGLHKPQMVYGLREEVRAAVLSQCTNNLQSILFS